jgi:GNAT superfamily N-acetyltransferase
VGHIVSVAYNFISTTKGFRQVLETLFTWHTREITMHPNISVREAGPADIDQLVALLYQLFSIERDFTFDASTQAQGLALMLDGCGKHRTIKVAAEDKKIVAMCTAQTRISTARGGITAVVEDMVVEKAHRGKGIGSQLLRAVEEWAALRGIDHLQLLADKNNAPGLAFYKQERWQPTQLVCLTKSL